MTQVLKEAKDLDLYKKVLTLLGDYSDSFPATAAGKLYKEALKLGIKSVPKDKEALAILSSVVDCEDSVPAKVQKLINLRFSDLPFEYQPMYKDGRRSLVAFWLKDGRIYDRVVALLNLEGKGATGTWSDMSGKKVSLVKKEQDAKEDK